MRKVDRTADHAIDYEDSPPLDESFFTRPLADWPPSKETITIRLDADVLEWFRRRGRGYQTRINRVLRLFVEGQTAGRSQRRPASRKSRSRHTAVESPSPIGHLGKK